MYVSMYVCLHVCLYVCINVLTYVYVYIFKSAQRDLLTKACMYTHVQSCTHKPCVTIYMSVHKYTYACLYKYVYMYIYIYIHIKLCGLICFVHTH